MRILPPAAAAVLVLHALPSVAADMNLTVEIPRLEVAEYHRPYVAIWVERPDQSVAANLAVWYEVKKSDGTKWLAELRQWWRRSGRSQKLPIDGVTGATRPAGRQQLSFSSAAGPLAALAPGDYRLVVEAAREVGGREVVKIPFSWPAKQPQSLQATGMRELGTVSLALAP